MGPAAAGLPGRGIEEFRVIAVVNVLHRRDEADSPYAGGRKQRPFALPAPGNVLHPAVEVAVNDFEVQASV